MVTLRAYQEVLATKVRAAWSRVRSVLLVLGTGGGKTVIFAWLIHEHRGASAAVVHRREIVAQISMALAKLDVTHRVVAPAATVTLIRKKHLHEFGRSYVDQHALCGVASVQTLTSVATTRDPGTQSWLRQVTLAVFDEGHHYVPTGVWARAVGLFDRARLLFVTATPERADHQGLSFCEEMVVGPSTQWLIDEGHLSRFKYVAPSTDLDVAGVAVTKSGDFSPRALSERVVESHIVGDVLSHYQQFGGGGQAIGFATDVAAAHRFAEAFMAAGIEAVALCGETEQGERDRALSKFQGGGITVLWNVDLFDEGFDVPAANVALLARPTHSLAKYLQQCGRVLRPAPDGRPAVIIDPVRNWERHGLPNWPRQWSMEGQTRNARPTDTIPLRICEHCTQPYEAFLVACPYCGGEPEPAGRSLPQQVAGDLTLLDVDGLAALYREMGRADMPDDAYRQDQIARHIPAIGRPADLRRHQKGRYRRQVLRELMAWWAGCQPGNRPQGEIYKRFYHRFGVDMATALSLKASETDALIERIQYNFVEDMI